MGTPKALLEWLGAPLLVRHTEWLLAGGCDAVYVVTAPANADPVRAAPFPPGVAVVVNAAPARGMLSSLQRGLAAALSAGAERVVFTPVDVPLGGPEAIACVLGVEAAVAVAAWRGRPGHPVALSAAAARTLLAADPSQRTARDVLAGLGPVLVPTTDPGVVGNLNTPADVARWRRTHRGR